MEYLKDTLHETRIHTYIFEFPLKGVILQGVISLIPSTPVNEIELKSAIVRKLNDGCIFKSRTQNNFVGFSEEDITIVEDLIYDPRGQHPKGEHAYIRRPNSDTTSGEYFRNLLKKYNKETPKEEKKAAKEVAKQQKVDAYHQKKKEEAEAIASGKSIVREKPMKVAIEVILEKVVEYFSAPRKMTDAAKDLNLQYQKVRYALMLIKDKGFKDNKYTLIESTVDECKAFTLKKGK